MALRNRLRSRTEPTKAFWPLSVRSMRMARLMSRLRKRWMSVITAPKVSLEIVMIVGGIVARPAFARGIGGKFAGKRQELDIEPLGMDIARQPQMLEHRDMAVEHLQHEIIDVLQAAAGARIGGVARQFLELGLDPADHPVEPAGEHGKAAVTSAGGANFAS